MSHEELLAIASSLVADQDDYTPTYTSTTTTYNSNNNNNNTSSTMNIDQNQQSFQNETDTNEVYNEKIRTLCDIIGVPEETAKHYLEACAYDLDATLALHIPDSGNVGGGGGRRSFTTNMSTDEVNPTDYPNIREVMVS